MKAVVTFGIIGDVLFVVAILIIFHENNVILTPLPIVCYLINLLSKSIVLAVVKTKEDNRIIEVRMGFERVLASLEEEVETHTDSIGNAIEAFEYQMDRIESILNRIENRM